MTPCTLLGCRTIRGCGLLHVLAARASHHFGWHRRQGQADLASHPLALDGVRHRLAGLPFLARRVERGTVVLSDANSVQRVEYVPGLEARLLRGTSVDHLLDAVPAVDDTGVVELDSDPAG